MAKRRFTTFASRLKALISITDNFNRADNASDLGKAGTMSWKIWRGTWGISGNKASSSTAASSYPLATLNFTSTDVTISIGSPEAGMGASFWVSDADNWWAATYEQVYSCQTCSACSSYNPLSCCAFNTFTYCSAYSTVTGNACCNNAIAGNPCCNSCKPKTTPPIGFCQTSYNPYSKNPTTYNPYSRNPTNYPCNANATSYPCSGNCYSFSCANVFFFSCNCATTYSMKLLSDIASTISTAASSTFSSAIASFKAILSGNNVTVRAYSDSAWTTQIGSDWSTNLASPNKTKAHGIIKAPATYSQGSTIDEFRVP